MTGGSLRSCGMTVGTLSTGRDSYFDTTTRPRICDMEPQLELGLDTFGDVTRGADGKLLPHAQVIRDIVAEAVLADELGVDFIGVGEHHRADFAVSSPE